MNPQVETLRQELKTILDKFFGDIDNPFAEGFEDGYLGVPRTERYTSYDPVYDDYHEGYDAGENTLAFVEGRERVNK